MTLKQTPQPGTSLVAHTGDTTTFTLETLPSEAGTAWIRTNLGHGKTRLREIVDHVERDRPILACDWHDLPMRRVDANAHTLTLPLTEIGRFEAKAFLLPRGTEEPVWPPGPNVVIKVEPADYSCANSIYTVFVRQFGPNKYPRAALDDARFDDLEQAGYSVIPPSGTFRDVIDELDLIVDELRSRIVLLLPIHPVPTTYARMGRFGSPFAALDFMNIDPALAEFDRRATPMDQFTELADAIHGRGARLFIDLPINHTGWASTLQIEHPEWFARGVDRSFESPGAWGVTWEDLAKLDYTNTALWTYMADVFLFWCRRSVDGFRCDAGYMIPPPVWRYIVAKVRRQYPNTIFLLEGLGGDPSIVDQLLDHANLNWAYSELFQNHDRAQIAAYLPGALATSATKGLLVHFAETHDNDRLASISADHARMRTTLAAACSHHGGFGITNGLEWLATAKIDVHDARSLNWGSRENLTGAIRRLNTLLRVHPAFHADATIRLIESGVANAIAVLRTSADGGRPILFVVNLDEKEAASVAWARNEFPCHEEGVYDLLSSRHVALEAQDDRVVCRMAPGEALCLTPMRAELEALEAALGNGMRPAEPWATRCMRAKALEIRTFFRGIEGALSESDADRAAQDLAGDPRAYCSHCVCPQGTRGPFPPPPVARWAWPSDLSRTVMLPPGRLLLVTALVRFDAELRSDRTTCGRESSLPGPDGSHFAVFCPPSLEGAEAEQAVPLSLVLTVYAPDGVRHAKGAVMLLPLWPAVRAQRSLDRPEVETQDAYALLTNGRGGMAQVRGLWGTIQSQYDALLAGNLNPDYPVDRRVMLTRCRVWVVCRGYSQEVDRDCLERFRVDGNEAAAWSFRVPTYEGQVVRLDIRLEMIQQENAVRLIVRRHPAGADVPAPLSDDIPVDLIVRPDIEDRISHAKTKAHAGPETTWPNAIQTTKHGFSFTPVPERRLRMATGQGGFTAQPEWTYGVAHPLEAERGLGDSSDLFSPGYFRLPLQGGDTVTVTAEIDTDPDNPPRETDANPADVSFPLPSPSPVAAILKSSLHSFVVKRGDRKTVIAGYPWFLDWGRDTLICLRGMIAAGMSGAARSILLELAAHELDGTLPNILAGGKALNRDTSDAPLWMFQACRDLVTAEGSTALLAADAGGRPLAAILRSIVDAYMGGTPNGIRMDADSALIFSPSHFTWMDTNHPAATPRQGYPIEIQALWHAALTFLAEADAAGPWHTLAERVETSIETLYPVEAADTGRFLADCLHATPGRSAREATPDDHVRPNQLLAITLGAVRDKALAASIVECCEPLLVPGAVRSLADRPVRRALPVEHEGRILNDPGYPYWGRYTGDEDTRRKPAYHNGTAWTWLFPSYSEALYATHGEPARETALALLGSCAELINRGCLGHVPEIVDGDTPHRLRGCGAQAWGASEFYRVQALLDTGTPCDTTSS